VLAAVARYVVSRRVAGALPVVGDQPGSTGLAMA